MLAAGVVPDIISSDAHGLFPVMHDDSALDYSLAGDAARPSRPIDTRLAEHPRRDHGSESWLPIARRCMG